MKYLIVFYHPKNPLNARDICRVGSKLNAKVFVVPRPGSDVCSEIGDVDVCICTSMGNGDLAELLGDSEVKCVIVLETYGYESIVDVAPRCVKNSTLALVVGAEDYGVPRGVVEELAERVGSRLMVAKIPYTAYGYSYNVVSALVMAIYELERAKHSTSMRSY